MGQLEDKIWEYKSREYKSATRDAAIGLGVVAIGCIFDYGIVDDITRIVGSCIFGLNMTGPLNYVEYLLRRRKMKKLHPNRIYYIIDIIEKGKTEFELKDKPPEYRD